jgi:Uma2 family endonuclease
MNARQEWLLARWDQACHDPELTRLPHKVELNEWGKIELTPPAPPMHGSLAFAVAKLMEQILGPRASVECPVLTSIGIRVPDAVWLVAERGAELDARQPLLRAPEVCVEVLSASNSSEELEKKTAAYLEAGAQEVVWLDPDRRHVRYFDVDGEGQRSRYGVPFESLFV